MKTATSSALHGAAVVFAATMLTIAYEAISAYVIGSFDPKFGAAGTVKLAGLIIVFCSALAAVGSGLFHFFWSSETRRDRPVLYGVLVGVITAAIHRLVLFEMPLIPDISDWPQQCVYFLALGIMLHWLMAARSLNN